MGARNFLGLNAAMCNATPYIALWIDMPHWHNSRTRTKGTMIGLLKSRHIKAQHQQPLSSVSSSLFIIAASSIATYFLTLIVRACISTYSYFSCIPVNIFPSPHPHCIYTS